MGEDLGGKKLDTGKPGMYLLPGESLREVARVLDYGKQKYAAGNWAKGMKWSRLISAAQRHLFAFSDGEDKDEETGISHLAHATCCLLFLLYYEKHFPELDDRWCKNKEVVK